jgi:SAM-dependent methyltransferase
MIIEKLKYEKIVSDEEFDLIYPSDIKSLSKRHWTPVSIAKIASDFLCYDKDLKILDIGSGVGKFCMVGATLKPQCQFFGIDIRENYIKLSNKLKGSYRIRNVEFLNKDILELSLNYYDCIYFFNSFQERIDNTAYIDNYSELSYDLYKDYTKHIFSQFDSMPIGTRIATYHTADFYIPGNYTMVGKLFDAKLKFYIKTNNLNLKIPFQEEKVAKHILRNAL